MILACFINDMVQVHDDLRVPGSLPWWKIVKKTKFKSPLEVDLYQDLEEIEEYTRNFVLKPDK